MHEYPITLVIIRIAEKAAREGKASRVSKVSLVIGDLSGYVGDSVNMYFEEISKGTMCECADLEIRRIRPQVLCAGCGKTFERKPFLYTCPECGGEARPTKIGTEFYIDHIEVENDNPEGEEHGKN